MKEYDLVIGLEIHAEVNTNTKVFCSCKNSFGEEPNTNCCPGCLGLPGSLPVLNKKAVEYTVKTGLCLGCEISPLSVFERKNYFYPDLSKAYQISQLVKPLCLGGGLELDSGKFIRLNRIHLEEDAGKLIHKTKTIGTLVDNNRGGIPLMELVTEPDISSASEAVEFLDKLRRTLIYAGVANCKMEQGGMRCDVNLSIKEKGSSKLGTRTEMKNLNSFKMVTRAIEYETKRQIEEIEAGNKIIQQTRKWDDNKGKSYAMRSKENSNDYRYFPDPDLLTVTISKQSIEEIRKSIPELAKDRIIKYTEQYNLPEYDARILTNEKFISDYFDQCLKLTNRPKQLSNWIMTQILKVLKDNPCEDLNEIINAENLVAIVDMLEQKEITRPNANELFNILCFSNLKAKAVAKEKGMLVTLNDEELENFVDEVLKNFADALKDYSRTPEKVIMFFTGKVMALSKGQANPLKTQGLLKNKIPNIIKE
ncbi:MAG: Asp-tRNA(Asn)/Glu-tRNA(Gln) amidotransferase subunit GatB [Clostridia bacterium]|nr:Asp-tRNA(Asn)/Glu-tRNA(Gln) amidotransferase subunit GatB [Clostridia bacterium]MDD4685783.1 Asp-tRNA(Asn)/Glu-tRNA(Gln) amidotransferase subunit GatB [Clostridia bacterium]